METDLGRVGVVARWKPVHLGHEAMLRALAERASLLTVGIGSSNRHDVRNPWSAAESRAMLELVLAPWRARVRFVLVPDLGHGPRWRRLVRRLFGRQDVFVSANEYVRSLLARDYRVVHPASVVPRARWVPLDATMVREAMARGGGAWRAMVPPAVARWLDESGLVRRFRRELGLETLARAQGALPKAPAAEDRHAARSAGCAGRRALALNGSDAPGNAAEIDAPGAARGAP